MRAAMAGIVNQMRLLIADPPGVDEVFSDDELLSFAEAHRTDAYYQPLAPLPTIAAGGATSYLEWAAEGGGWWASDTTLVDGSYNVLTPAASDWQRGVWTFATNQQSVLVRGARYDVTGAAADAVEAWLAKLALAYDFGADGAEYKRSQQREGLQQLLTRLRGSAGGGILSARLVRSDTC